jgi:hypothetical protein
VSEKELAGAGVLNIDSFFREQAGNKDAVADESEEDKPDTSKEAPDKKQARKGVSQTDEDSDDDFELEDEDESEEDDEKDEDDSDDADELDEEEDPNDKKKKKDNSKELSALQKKANHAELQRAQMQSERDTWKTQFEKANSNIETLTKRVEQLTSKTEQLTKKTEQSDSSDLFSGDDEALMTEGRMKKLLDWQAKMLRKSDNTDDDDAVLTKREAKRLLAERAESLSDHKENQQQPKIGSDLESEKIWAEGQPDVVEVSSYYVENKTTLDPELATVPSYAGRFNLIRVKRMESELMSTKSELTSAKKALRKAKLKIKRMAKGELPETASGNRRKPEINDNQPEDRLVSFFAK